MKKYANPPLIEAICDFHFIPGQPWDWTVLGLVYDQIKGEFPNKFQPPGPMFNVSIGTPPSGPMPGMVRMQFQREDGSALVQVGPDNLTINHLTPYSGWPGYRDMIAGTLSAYRGIAAPQGLSRIALRYVNRINIPARLMGEFGVEIGDYVLAQPSVPDRIPQVFSSWAQRVEMSFDEANMVLVLQSGTGPGSEAFPVSILLDLTMSPPVQMLPPMQPIALDAALMWLEQAHTSIESVFEECLGPKARELFGLEG